MKKICFLKTFIKLDIMKIKSPRSDINNKYLIIAFQRRFRQSLINGKIDKECLLISNNLTSNKN